MLVGMIQSLYRWRGPAPVSIDRATRELGAESGISERLLAILAARGVAGAAALTAFLAPAEEGLHDPRLLPDAEAAVARVALAQAQSERVLVYGDFDADGLTGLSILVLALRHLGLDAEAYVPERLGDGHGLSTRAIDRAVAEGRTLIVTADCGTSSGPEIELAASRGVDVLVTDHHHAATWPAAAVAVVNPQRADSNYPERQLTGAGVAWKVAALLIAQLDGEGPPAGAASIPEFVRELADLALIGTVADVAPILGENRAIARLGLSRLRNSPRPGLAALLERAGLAPDRVDLEDIGFVVAPRLNAAGRVGEAARAARLLLADDRLEADALAAEIEKANLDRREMTRVALAEARRELGLDLAADAAAETGGAPTDTAEIGGAPAATAEIRGAPVAPPDLPDALLVRGEWPVGIIGLVAGRLAEDLDRPAVVATLVDPEAGILRASCRSPGGCNLAEALIACEDLLIRHGGHAAAAGFDIVASRWPEFTARFLELASRDVRPAGPRELIVDLVLPADSVDYGFVREIALLDPTGVGNPVPTLAITGLRVVRVRAASGGHTQLVLGRRRDVLDAVAFRRSDLPAMLHEGDRIDVVARATSRTFGGFESIQLEVVDVAAEGAQPATAGASRVTPTATPATPAD
jgi:single-stranded-DNA-specific exonuclease